MGILGLKIYHLATLLHIRKEGEYISSLKKVKINPEFWVTAIKPSGAIKPGCFYFQNALQYFAF
jgi:hypothetical protein